MKKYNSPVIEVIESPDIVTISQASTEVDTGKIPFINNDNFNI